MIKVMWEEKIGKIRYQNFYFSFPPQNTFSYPYLSSIYPSVSTNVRSKTKRKCWGQCEKAPQKSSILICSIARWDIFRKQDSWRFRYWIFQIELDFVPDAHRIIRD